MKHICIDARMYGLEHAGIGRYIKNLVDRLVKDKSKFTWSLIISNQSDGKLSFPDHVNIHPAQSRHYSFKEQTEIPKLINSIKPDLIHFPHFNVPLNIPFPFVVTIHDILWHQIKGPSVTTLSPIQYAIKYQGYKLTVNQAVKKARAIIVPSQWVKQQLSQEFPHLQSDKIHVTYEGVDDSLTKSQVGEEMQSKTNFPSPYLIYTGSVYPHKNIQLLLYALKTYNQQSVQKVSLVIVSSRDVFLQEIKAKVIDMEIADKVIFAGFLSDPELRYAYENAVALVHPSLSEGFGLTGLEAMAVGLPVISSDASALPEVYGDAALYFDPHDVHNLTLAIATVIEDEKRKNQLIKTGYQQVKKYSWIKTVNQTLQIYHKTLNI